MKILKFSADWCRPCKKLTETLDQMVLPYVVENKDIDAEPGLASAYAVRSVPTMILVDAHGTNKVSIDEITNKIRNNFDLSPGGIIESLNLRRPIYKQTAAYGHFGRKPGSNGEFSWEKTDKTGVFKK